MTRLKYYGGSLLSAFMSILIIGCCIEQGGVLNGLFSMGLGPLIIILLIGVGGGFLAIDSFSDIVRKNFLDYFFLVFLICGALCSIIGGIIILIVKGVFEYSDSLPSSPKEEKNETYKIGKNVAGYDRIFNEKGEEVASIESVRDDGDIYGTDGNRYKVKH